MKMTFFEVAKDQQDFFTAALPGAEITFSEDKITAANVNLAKDSEIISDFIHAMITKDIIDALPNLKMIATRSTGFDNIDVAYAATKGIQVCSVPAYGSETVAEFAFALILTLSRKIRDAALALRTDGDYSIPKNLQGFDLEGKTLGVVGTGKIGKNSVKIGKGFSMNVVGFDPYPDAAFAKENNFEYKTLDEVLAMSDIITLHAPYTKENHHLINQNNISKIKKGAYLINTARGELVENEALLAALHNGTLAGAGLDVLEGERDIKKGDTIPMLQMENVVMTPHMAAQTREAAERIMQTTVENIKAFIAGAPVNLVK